MLLATRQCVIIACDRQTFCCAKDLFGVEIDLLRSGLNCDVLIHEATMEDELAEDAAKKRHRYD